MSNHSGMAMDMWYLDRAGLKETIELKYGSKAIYADGHWWTNISPDSQITWLRLL